jgi:SAM-dependent methyltransferase
MTLAHRVINMSVRCGFAFCPTYTGVLCPVCCNSTAKRVRYGRSDYVTGESSSLSEVAGHTKHLCCKCGHCYATWLQGDLQDTADKYAGIYNNSQLLQEGPRAGYEESLFRYVLKHCGGSRDASLLDFGCGPNRTPVEALRREGVDAHGCDILPIYDYDGDVFFRHTGDATPWKHRFDGIVSIDVIEHLADTLESWVYLNRILKPNGIMAHCFPSQLHYSFIHAYFRTPFHVCLFSRKSLQRLLDQSGFVLESIEPFDADVPYVFRFRKVREVDA